MSAGDQGPGHTLSKVEAAAHGHEGRGVIVFIALGIIVGTIWLSSAFWAKREGTPTVRVRQPGATAAASPTTTGAASAR